MRRLLFLSLFLALLAIWSPASSLQTCQEPCFNIRQIRIHHQGTWRTLNLKIWYLFEACEQQIPPNHLVKKAVQQFVIKYPNSSDFWEVMNKNLVRFLIEKFPKISTLEVEIAVAPDEMFPTQRRSIIKYQDGNFEEFFSFKYVNDANLDISYRLCQCSQPTEYPDFQWLRDATDAFLMAEWDASQNWEIIKGKLMKFLEQQFPMIQCADIQFVND
jgi:hypothetical protein